MEILLWLVPATVVTGIAMGWAGWVGRERPDRERSEADRQRMAQALRRPMPTEPEPGARPRQRLRSTGVALRRTGDSGPVVDPRPADRRSA